MTHNRRMRALLLCLLLCLLLSSCKKSDGKLGPSAYEISGDTVSSMNTLLEGEGGDFVSVERPEPAEQSEANQKQRFHDTQIFHYEKLPEGGKTVEAYVTLLLAEKKPFVIVNSTGAITDPPDYSQEAGTVILSRANFETLKNLWLVFRWEKEDCSITAYLTDADPNQKAHENKPTTTVKGEATRAGGTAGASGTSGAASSSGSSMTPGDAVSYLMGLSPSALGLPGDSMNEYHVYYQDGTAKVDNETCIRLQVYEISPPEGSNSFVGSFLLSSDKGKI